MICIIKRNRVKHVGDFYCSSCLHLFRTKKKIDFHKKVCGNKDFCGDVMPLEGTNKLGFNQFQIPKFNQDTI